MSEGARAARLAPLGVQRLRITSCLGGDMPRLPQYFDPSLGEDVFGAFRSFIGRMVQRTASASDAATRSLIGAGRLLTGDLSGADEVIDHLPAEPYALDHGAGYCLVAPAQALKAALPALPGELHDTSRWLSGSSEQAALRAWLARHRSAFVWDEARAIYLLVERGDAPGNTLR